MTTEVREKVSPPQQPGYINGLTEDIGNRLSHWKPVKEGWLQRQMQVLPGETRGFLTDGLTDKMADLSPDKTVQSDEDFDKEKAYFQDLVARSGKRTIKREGVDPNDPDKLWVLSKLQFTPNQMAGSNHNLAYQDIYTIVRSAQLRERGADINPNATAEQVHQITLGLGDKVINYLNNRQMVFGDNPAFGLLATLTAETPSLLESSIRKYPQFTRVEEFLAGEEDIRDLESAIHTAQHLFQQGSEKPFIYLWEDYSYEIGRTLFEQGRFKAASACFGLALREYLKEPNQEALGRIKYAEGFLLAMQEYHKQYNKTHPGNSQDDSIRLFRWVAKDPALFRQATEILDDFFGKVGFESQREAELKETLDYAHTTVGLMDAMQEVAAPPRKRTDIDNMEVPAFLRKRR